MNLVEKKCVPCSGATPPLKEAEIDAYLASLKDWQVAEGMYLKKSYTLKDFVAAMAFVNRIADIAEQEGHHPDINIHYNVVGITLWTHAIKGLSENDFIVAAKIDALD